MDKQKLLGIILKDLEQLKNLSEEIAEAENDASLIVDLALSKARLVVQEIGLLHEYTPAGKNRTEAIQPEEDQDNPEDELTETYPDPDLEILHFDGSEEQQEPDEELTETEQSEEPQPEEDPVAEEETEVETEPLPEDEIEEIEEVAEKKLQEAETPDEKHVGPEADEDEEEEEEIVVYNEDEDDEDDDLQEKDLEDDEEHEIEINKLEDGSHAGVREIHIDDLDDEEADSFKFTPTGKPQERSAFHEVPKPENTPRDKQIIGEKFKKEPSLNDSMAEKRSGESKITNGPISSLRASIGLNDRFLFIREIFDNNAEKYNAIIDHLDKLETIQQAVEYLKSNLVLEKNDTSMKFVDLLKRRFTR